MCVSWNTRPKTVHEIRVLWFQKFGKPFWKGVMYKTILKVLQDLTVENPV